MATVPAYAAAKAGLIHLTRALALEWARYGIRVNALSPGPIATRAASGIAHFDALIDEARERAPQQRLVTLDEVGAMAACLASGFASSVTGNIAYIDGGYHVMS